MSLAIFTTMASALDRTDQVMRDMHAVPGSSSREVETEADDVWRQWFDPDKPAHEKPGDTEKETKSKKRKRRRDKKEAEVARLGSSSTNYVSDTFRIPKSVRHQTNQALKRHGIYEPRPVGNQPSNWDQEVRRQCAFAKSTSAAGPFSWVQASRPCPRGPSSSGWPAFSSSQ